MVVVEIARRHCVGVITKNGIQSLVRRAGIMRPAVLLERSVHARVWQFLGDLLVVSGILKAQEIVQVIAGYLSGWLAKDAEPRQIFGVDLARKVESQQSLFVADIGFYGEGVLACGYK